MPYIINPFTGNFDYFQSPPSGDVLSFAVSGQPPIYGDVTLSSSGTIVLTQSGQDIQIYSPDPPASGDAVNHLNGLMGDVTIAGSGTTVIAVSGQSINVYTPASGAAVNSIAASGSSPLTGAVTISGTNGNTVTEASQNINVAGANSFAVVQADSGSNASATASGATLTLASANAILSIASSSATNTETFTINQGSIDVNALTNYPVTIAHGGTAATAASDARTNLGLAIGTNVEAWDADLDAIAALTGVGLATRSATASTWALRTITGTAAEITVTNGDGAAGNPTISLPTALTFTGKTVTGGTFVSPALTTPSLGTPTSGTLTNCTGLPISSGISGLGTGVATFLATPSSSNLATAVTDETGSGSLVFATSPTLVTPLLGTPTSGTLTNCTGLPVASGISGLGTGVATFLATPTSANLLAAVTNETGTGALVFATSPTLVTPLLGTPTSGTLTNCTGLPVSSGISGLGTGVATFLATPSSANLASAVTDETGSGALVFATSPTLVTPLLGTPTSGILTNCTGLPVSSGISGLGAGVATFLATPSSANLITAVTDETGTGSLVFATSPTLVTPLLGTPTSGTLTNCTGLPISTGVSGLGTGVATFLATPSSANLAAAVTNETGSGSLVFGTTPTFTTNITTPLVIGGTGTTSTLTLRSTSGVGAAGADIIFQTGNNGATEAMRILNSGKVGIGMSPVEQLDVAGKRVAVTNSSSVEFAALYATNNSALSAEYGITGSSYTTYGALAANMAYTYTTQSIVLMADGASSRISFACGGNAEQLRLTNAGRLGLNTTAPAVLFHQDGGNATATYHKFTAGTTTGITASDGFDVGITSAGVAQVRQRANLSLQFYTNDTLGLTLANNAAATFVGEVRITGDISGVAGSTTFTGTSDITANSTGTGTIKLKGATNRNTSGFLKVYIGTADYYIPVFAAITG